MCKWVYPYYIFIASCTVDHKHQGNLFILLLCFLTVIQVLSAQRCDCCLNTTDNYVTYEYNTCPKCHTKRPSFAIKLILIGNHIFLVDKNTFSNPRVTALHTKQQIEISNFCYMLI